MVDLEISLRLLLSFLFGTVVGIGTTSAPTKTAGRKQLLWWLWCYRLWVDLGACVWPQFQSWPSGFKA